MNARSIHRIVLTGAPASGKTVLFERLRTLDRLSGFVFLDELARRLLEENPDYRNDWSRFHVEIYRRQVAREKALGGKPFVTDRGTVDAFAFHPETMADINTSLEAEYARYDAVFHLGSAASLGKRYYIQDDIRTESIEDVLHIERAIRGVWQKHPGYQFLAADYDLEKKWRELVRIVTDLISEI